MMSKVPEIVQLVETILRCPDCGAIFTCRTSEDNMLVKFVDDSGTEEAWLPTFEEGGYLDVVEQCVPGFSRDQQITMQIFQRFEEKFRELLHKPASGGEWKVASGCFCPCCKNANTEILSERIVINPKVTWISYNPIH